jgi:hypothetical protein
MLRIISLFVLSILENSSQAYWIPRSEWKINSWVTGRFQVAIIQAGRMVSAADKPVSHQPNVDNLD